MSKDHSTSKTSDGEWSWGVLFQLTPLLSMERIFLNLKRNWDIQIMGKRKPYYPLLQNVLILLSFLSIKIIVVVLCVKLSSERCKMCTYGYIYLPISYVKP